MATSTEVIADILKFSPTTRGARAKGVRQELPALAGPERKAVGASNHQSLSIGEQLSALTGASTKGAQSKPIGQREIRFPIEGVDLTRNPLISVGYVSKLGNPLVPK